MSSFLANSQMMMPAVTDTLSECFVPYWGISRQPSQESTTSLHLVAQHHGITSVRLGRPAVEHRTAFRLLHGKDRIAVLLQPGDSLQRIFIIGPCHTVFCSQRGLVYLRLGRGCRDAAQADAFHTERVRRAEHRTDIVQAAHVIEYDHQRHLLGLFELVHRQTVHLGYLQLSHEG